MYFFHMRPKDKLVCDETTKHSRQEMISVSSTCVAEALGCSRAETQNTVIDNWPK